MTRLMSLLLLGFILLWALGSAFICFCWDGMGLAASISREQVLAIHSMATGLCLAPMFVTCYWTRRAKRSTPEKQLLALIGGICLRMFFVLGAGMILTRTMELLSQHETLFWLWVLVVYLVTLGVEIGILAFEQDTIRGTQGSS